MVTDKDITKFRKKSGMSREALADKVGVTSQTLWRWERGAVIPRPAQQALEHIMAKSPRASG